MGTLPTAVQEISLSLKIVIFQGGSCPFNLPEHINAFSSEFKHRLYVRSSLLG